MNEEYNFKIRVNGEWIDKTVVINSIDVKIEGYSALVSIADDLKFNGRDVLAVDVGGNTTDVIPFAWSHKYQQFVPGIPDTIKIRKHVLLWITKIYMKFVMEKYL